MKYLIVSMKRVITVHGQDDVVYSLLAALRIPARDGQGAEDQAAVGVHELQLFDASSEPGVSLLVDMVRYTTWNRSPSMLPPKISLFGGVQHFRLRLRSRGVGKYVHNMLLLSRRVTYRHRRWSRRS